MALTAGEFSDSHIANSKLEEMIDYSYIINFETNSEQKIDTMVLSLDNNKKNLPVLNKDGYSFAGWYKDSDFTFFVDSVSSINKNLTLYAKWVKVVDNPSENDFPEENVDDAENKTQDTTNNDSNIINENNENINSKKIIN